MGLLKEKEIDWENVLHFKRKTEKKEKKWLSVLKTSISVFILFQMVFLFEGVLATTHLIRNNIQQSKETFHNYALTQKALQDGDIPRALRYYTYQSQTPLAISDALRSTQLLAIMNSHSGTNNSVALSSEQIEQFHTVYNETQHYGYNHEQAQLNALGECSFFNFSCQILNRFFIEQLKQVSQTSMIQLQGRNDYHMQHLEQFQQYSQKVLNAKISSSNNLTDTVRDPYDIYIAQHPKKNL